MLLKKFLAEIEKLKPSLDEVLKAGLPSGEHAKWQMDVIDKEFNAYEGPIDQMVYCLDTIRLFYGFQQMDDIDEEIIEDHNAFGINPVYNFYYAYNYMNDEVVLIDDTKTQPVIFCAIDQYKFLDGLLEVAKFERLRIAKKDNEDAKNEAIQQAAQAAGGKKYEAFYKILIG